jgi:septal ring-binding cell division protein DamX
MKKHQINSGQINAVICVILTGLAFMTSAKEKNDDTNIICFAAKNKWICAPEGKKEIANNKAKKLLQANKSELNTSDVVIKTIKIPKFDSPASINTAKSQTKSTHTILKPNNINIQHSPMDNAYAKLWSHQLIGVSTPQSAVNFVKNNKLDKNEILIIKSTRANMDWWIVLYGLYKDKQTGQDNESNLPSIIKKPWLRPLKNLQVNGFIEKF